MGTAISASDEWIELYNNTQRSITLDSWRLAAQDGTPNISLSGVIPANGFYLLERTNDETVPNISADKIYTGALGNSGEYLILYDNSNNVVDEIDCSAGWVNGDNSTKQTMEKIFTGWQTSENPNGTPKFQNSAGITIKSDTGQAVVETQESSPEPIIEQIETIPIGSSEGAGSHQNKKYPNGIIFNEILPSPEGPDETNEWIELFNRNTFEADISGWMISDTIGKTTPYVFPEGAKIESKNFFVIYRPTTKIVLNNDGDGLRLLNPDGDMVDETVYGKAVLNQSYSLLGKKWDWSTALTPGKENSKGGMVKEEYKNETTTPTNELAAVVEQISTPSKPLSFPALLMSFIIAFLSGIIILSIKKLQQKKNLLQ